MVYKIEDLLSLRLVPDISVGVHGQPWILGQNLCRKRCEWYWDRTQTTNKGIVFIDSIKLRLQKVTKVMLFFVLPESGPPSGNFARQKRLKRETKRPIAK